MRKLQAELDEYMPDRKAVPDFATLCKLPYLNAFVKEGASVFLGSKMKNLSDIIAITGLRIYGAAPSVLERVVPSTSSTVDDSFDMMGYALPAGTVVGTQAWSMHRDTEIFPSPETFLPERWLSVEGVSGEEERLSR